jgi:hypothetical protein
MTWDVLHSVVAGLLKSTAHVNRNECERYGTVTMRNVSPATLGICSLANLPPLSVRYGDAVLTY